MHRAISVSVLALILIGWCCLSRAADTDPLKGLTQKIEAGNLTGRDLAEAYMQRGAMRMILKDESGAAADYDQAVSTAPKLADAYLWRSFGRSETGDFQHAVDDISQALSLGLADEAAGYYFRAEALRQMKDYRRAIDDYDHAIALDRDFGYAFIGRGEAKTDAGDEAGALTDLTQAVEDGGAFYVSKKWPFRTTPYLALLFGNYLVESTPDKAPPQAYLARGRLLLQMGKYDRARPDLEYVVQKDFQNPDPWLYMGLENLATHDCHEGRYDLDKAAELMSTPVATLVREHQAFIDKTPCKGDLVD